MAADVAVTKTCSRCEMEKSVEDFPFRSAALGTRHARCKPCVVETTRVHNHTEARRAQERAYHLEHAEKRNAQRSARQRRQCEEDPLYWRAAELRYRYDLTLGDYQVLLEAQGGKCAICRRDAAADRPLDVDHCHEAGRVRGLLCRQCNVTLGLMADDPERLRAAARYLEEASTATTGGDQRWPPS